MSEQTTIEPEPHVRRRWLPAAPTGWTLVAFVVAIAFLAGTIGWTIGRGRTPARSSADVAFLDDMIRHHESAVALSQLEAANGTEEQIKTFAKEILKYQSYEIGLMDAWLDHWGYDRETVGPKAMGWMGHQVDADAMPGMPSAADVKRLENAQGRDADALFVALMTAHHAGGVQMAEEAMKRVDNGYVKVLATRMASAQRAEVAEMEAARRRVDLPKVSVDEPVALAPEGSGMDMSTMDHG